MLRQLVYFLLSFLVAVVGPRGVQGAEDFTEEHPSLHLEEDGAYSPAWRKNGHGRMERHEMWKTGGGRSFEEAREGPHDVPKRRWV